jgi:hypothetical protein
VPRGLSKTNIWKVTGLGPGQRPHAVCLTCVDVPAGPSPGRRGGTAGPEAGVRDNRKRKGPAAVTAVRGLTGDPGPAAARHRPPGPDARSWSAVRPRVAAHLGGLNEKLHHELGGTFARRR